MLVLNNIRWTFWGITVVSLVGFMLMPRVHIFSVDMYTIFSFLAPLSLFVEGLNGFIEKRFVYFRIRYYGNLARVFSALFMAIGIFALIGQCVG